MVDSVCMWHFGRCGSTVLCRMLSEHPDISWHGEFYLNIFQRWYKRAGKREVVGELQEDPVQMLEDKMAAHEEGWFLFEMKTWHPRLLRMTIEEFVREARNLGVDRHVLLERKNRLRILTSILVAHQRGKYHNKSGRASDLTTVQFPVGENIHADFSQQTLVEHLRDYDQQWKDLQAALEGDTLHITYEDHIQDNPAIAHREVCEFLGLEPNDVDPDLSRTNPHPLSEIIENFDEVEQRLRGTEWEWMLGG